jgi:diguanylate cyclase (GGDEF)-like protein
MQTPTKVTIGSESYFALYAPLPDTPANAGIGFVTLHSYRNVMAIYNRFRIALAAVTGVALLLALAASAGVAHSLTRPLDGVVQAARTLQEGGWPEPFDVRRSDEIGLLQSVFNEMTTAMRESQARLLALIDIDPLTELDNHRRFQERLTQETARCSQSGESLSLLLFDIDHFQAYNRQYGHAAGDKALQQLAHVLRECLPEVAISSRFGGEEFAVLLPQHGPESAEQVAEQIRLAANIAWRETGMGELTVSAGCATFGTHTSRAEGLVLAVELAVSQAKQLGRNRVCRFDSMPGADPSADPYQLHQFLKDGSLATIQALAAAVDAKDTYTQGHSQRVAQYAAELAAYVGLTKAEVDLVFTAGSLHDVGKIGVPDAILKKVGRLTEEEKAVMETHPVLGEVIVRKAPQLAATLPGIRSHHERWDGRGYPDGLAGENIPLIARILAVVDTFDAMTSDRPYRKGLAWEIALQEIAKGAGTQLDPRLAQAFVEMIGAKIQLDRAA